MVKNNQGANKGLRERFKFGRSNSHHFKDRDIRAGEVRMDFPNNCIKTSKYNIVNFFPKNLMIQFSRMANIYFLVIGLLSIIEEISTTNGQPIIFVPLALIILVSMIKDLVEDLKRHSSDSEENNRKTKVLRNGAFTECKWRDLRVGDLILIKENEYFPADILVLKSSGKKGAAYIETKNLDGETNLKFKTANKDISDDFQDEQMMSKARNQFKYEPPNVYLYKFVGSINTSKGVVPLGEQNFILRGCSLRNTESVVGLVTYTGHHTKIMMNSIKAKPKFSKLEKYLNKQIVRVFLVQILFCLFAGFYAAIWYSVKDEDLQYLDIDPDGSKDNSFAYNLFVRFGNWILLFANFVPISLLVTLEMVRLFQGKIMTSDPLMISTEEKTPTTVQTSNLSEELGQVEYIFSDKTGTLTKNLMEFKNLSVSGVIYGDKRDLKDEDFNKMPKVTNVDFRDMNLIEDLKNPSNKNHAPVVDCLKFLAVCHTIITEEKHGEIVYNAASPDELALCNFAKFVGSEFKGIDEDNNITINLLGKEYKYKLFHILEFNSTRKRMSLIVRNPEGQMLLMCKGADSILFERMEKTIDPTHGVTQSNLMDFANIGLRTLVLAQRVLDNKYFEDWNRRYHEASIKLDGRDEAMWALQAEIEVNLKLVGATAIEDKLQDDVGETIAKLKQSGIKVWVLTGDKVETAINIGYSCRLLNDDLEQLQVIETTPAEVKKSLEEKVQMVKGVDPETSKFALIISGEALSIATQNHLTNLVMQIGQVCNAVLACRVSPKQKQEIVSMVRAEKPKVTTLAIGDGANDVNMIVAAHVGVGIRGVEGQQAARASDFAIGEFKILRRLLYYHGREAYRRNANLILYNFYKNMVVVIPQFWFAFYSGFSGTTIYDQIVFQGFNIFYASVPILIYAVFDEEYSPKTLCDTPQLYTQGPKDKLFNTPRFWRWIGMGIYESFIVLFWSIFCLDWTFSDGSGGKTFGLYGAGMLAHSAAVWVVNVKVFSMSSNFYFLNVFFIIGSMLFYIMCFFIAAETDFTEVTGLFYQLYGNGHFWIASIIITAITFFGTYIYRSYHALKEVAISKQVTPIDQEVEKLVGEYPPVKIELKERKLNESHESDMQIEEKRPPLRRQSTTGHRGGYTGYAFSGPEQDAALMNAQN